uniref:Uncharacterized protein n=1 Tax=Arundo donax TaxID=35708 RepID=A0A0A9CJW5_ARUDO
MHCMMQKARTIFPLSKVKQ